MKDNSKAARARRQKDAAERQAEYNALSLQDKLDKAESINPGSKEFRRLNKLMEASGEFLVPSESAVLGKLLIQRDEVWHRKMKVDAEAQKLEQEISNLDVRVFIAQHDLDPKWEEVPREEWEHLKVGSTAALAIRRPKNDESFWLDYAIVDTWGEWSRGIGFGGQHFTAVKGNGRPVEPVRNITVKIWKRVENA